MRRQAIPTNSVALAGEFAALSQLCLNGYDASMTLGHTKNIDILVFDPNLRKTYQVEVKTNLECRNGPSDTKLFGRIVTDWQMNEKHEKIEDPNLFYCFVHINHKKGAIGWEFRFFIVPSRIVARHVRETHSLWLRADRSHKDTPRRLFRIGAPTATRAEIEIPLAEIYENNWGFKDIGEPR